MRRPGVERGQVDAAAFPRPSGRGSIAAPSCRCGAPPTSPLPPAIRPGLHCGGAVAHRGGLHCLLPPAIRPGLHCGDGSRRHQALRYTAFPRPSGRGSIAASPRPTGPGSPPPPSPGHQAGAPLRQLGGVPNDVDLHLASPGHQAGAPLRRWDPAGERRYRLRLPPAIRPGLHCGVLLGPALFQVCLGFPRPSGRGSIAAATIAENPSPNRATSPGHQAGAPLRQHVDCPRGPRQDAFPRPSGRGSIAATPAVRL